jgi:hypothetical protein
MAGASSGTAARIFVFCASLRSRHLEANRQLLIVDSPPTWMDEAELARMRETPLWLDEDPPQGLLRALVADRERE